ncbi:MAG: triose-phosphate isomerase [Planctomycetota bacterium]|nr:triose-phosphate isomerase [Planctomycetota bacterium]
MRRPFIAGNWKMNLDRSAVQEFCTSLSEQSGGYQDLTVGVFPPFVYLGEVAERLSGTGIVVGAQTCHAEEKGAFTGEVAAPMIREMGATHVIVGHSERRHLFGETNEDVRARAEAALSADLNIILCVGETLEERESGRTHEVVGGHLESGVAGLDGEVVASRITLAYEPVWAIGTGHTATPEQAQEVHAMIRGSLSEMFSQDVSDRVVLQYGGSVNPGNISDLMACTDVDGALVGGASLDMDSFQALTRYRFIGEAP